jgi:N6-adenosine-specific RNA methylase IME4
MFGSFERPLAVAGGCRGGGDELGIRRHGGPLFLLGTRGRPTQLSRRERNLIVAPVREHSRKPDAAYEMCERLWPGPYLELFAPYPRAGWVQWNNGQVLAAA